MGKNLLDLTKYYSYVSVTNPSIHTKLWNYYNYTKNKFYLELRYIDGKQSTKSVKSITECPKVCNILYIL